MQQKTAHLFNTMTSLQVRVVASTYCPHWRRLQSACTHSTRVIMLVKIASSIKLTTNIACLWQVIKSTPALTNYEWLATFYHLPLLSAIPWIRLRSIENSTLRTWHVPSTIKLCTFVTWPWRLSEASCHILMDHCAKTVTSIHTNTGYF